MCIEQNPTKPILYSVFVDKDCDGKPILDALEDGGVVPVKPFGLNNSIYKYNNHLIEHLNAQS